jgi:hypothetical protein
MTTITQPSLSERVDEDLLPYASDKQYLLKAVHRFLSQHSRYAAATAAVGAAGPRANEEEDAMDDAGAHRNVDTTVDWHACLYAFHAAHSNWKEAALVRPHGKSCSGRACPHTPL